MGERTDGLAGGTGSTSDRSTGSAYIPSPGLPDPGAPVFNADADDDIRIRATDSGDAGGGGDDLADDPEILRARAEIEETRAEMSETIDALKERLDPQKLKEDAKDSIREATIGRAEDAVQSAKDSAQQALQEAGATAKGAGNKMLETIKQNPVPAALIGVGAGWLLVSSRQSDAGAARYEGTYYASPRDRERFYSGSSPSGGQPMDEKAREKAEMLKQRAQQTAGQVRETASEFTDQAREKAKMARQGFQEQVHDNPLGVGLAALALGVAVGFALPETRQENRWMGEARDNMMEKAEESVQQVAGKVQTVAKEAVSSAKEAAQEAANEQGLSA